MRRTLIALTACAPLVTACGGEEEPDPNQPTFVSGEVRCRKVGTESTFELHQIDVVVEDLDGAEDLLDPEASVSMVVLSSTLSPNKKAEGPAGEEVRVRYTWEKTSGDEPIFCGDDGKLLVLEFEAVDAEGFPVSFFVPSKPL